MNSFQEKVKEMARDYENTQSNSQIAKAYYDGAMASFKLLFGVDAATIVEKAP